MKKSIFRWGFVLCMLVGLMTIAASAATPTHTACDGHTATTWTAVDQDYLDSKVNSSGTAYVLNATKFFYLTEDVVLKYPIYVNKNSAENIFCLNGFSVTCSEITGIGSYVGLFTEPANRALNICNCSTTGSNITVTAEHASLVVFSAHGAASVNGRYSGIRVFENITVTSTTAPIAKVPADNELYPGKTIFELVGGKITNGVGVVLTSGNFNMYDGSEISKTTTRGVNMSAGTFNMYGGTIKECTDGGVWVQNGGTFNMSGGTITENYVSSSTGNNRGHGVRVGYTSTAGTANITGGTISGNRLGSATAEAKWDISIYNGSVTVSGDETVVDYVYSAPSSASCTGTFDIQGGTMKGVMVAAGKEEIAVPGTDAVISGGLFTDMSANEVATYLSSTKPLCAKTVSDGAEGYDYKVTPGYQVTGENFDFKSSLNFGLTLGCDNGFVAESVVATVNGDAVDATIVDGVVTVEATGITAKEIGAPIAFSVKGTDDTVYFEDEISVADIAKEQYAEAEGNYAILLEDLINYGNEAAAVFGGTTVDALGTGADTLVYEWNHSEGYGASAADIAVATLSLKDKIVLNIYINGEANVGVYDETTGITTVTYDDIAIAEAMEPINLTFTVGGTEYTVVYSIADYVIDALEGEQADLISALQKYIDSVCAVCAEA